MNLGVRFLRRPLATLVLGLCALPAAHSHVMALDRASLNLRADGAYVALSLSPQALADLVLDDDGDGTISVAELQTHQAQVRAAIAQRVQLHDAQGALTLQALFVQFDAHPGSGAPQTSITAVGKFVLRPGELPTDWSLAFWPVGSGAHALQATVTRQADDGSTLQGQSMVFSAARQAQRLFPSAGAVLTDYMRLGARHILDGPDHLLFLLVVLATGMDWAALVLTLSAFTLGHATTLALGVLGQWTVSPALAEPAIALTIVLMALLDERARRQAVSIPTAQRMSLVFSCALIHGLGFASALEEIGLNPETVGWSLVGFNLGIELVQVCIAACMTLLYALLRRWSHAGALRSLRPLTLGAAVGLAGLWFVQRL